MATPPSFSTLSAAVRSAELLRGSLVRCGPGVRGVGWPETSGVRALALPHPDAGGHELVAVAYTAAWVWGAEWNNDSPIVFSTLQRMRFLRTAIAPLHVREYAIAPSDTVAICGVRVTTPERTVYDLLYLDEDEYELYGVNALRSLVEHSPHLARSDITRAFHTRNRPHRRRADLRFQEIVNAVGATR